MKHLIWIPILALALAACGDKPGDHDHGGDAHDHAAGPHGGEIGDIGDHEAHLEMVVNHGAEKIVAYVLTAENETLRIEAAPALTLGFEDGPKTLTGVAVGGTADGASEFHYRDKSLAGEFDSATFKLQWKGKPHEVVFEHDHEHGHGHDDDHEHDDDHDDDDHDKDHEHDDDK